MYSVGGTAWSVRERLAFGPGTDSYVAIFASDALLFSPCLFCVSVSLASDIWERDRMEREENLGRE